MTVLANPIASPNKQGATFRTTATDGQASGAIGSDWQAGVTWSSGSCGKTHIWLDDSCGPNEANPESKCLPEGDGCCNVAKPFAIYATETECFPGEGTDALSARATQAVEAGTDLKLGTALVTGECGLAQAEDISAGNCYCASTALGALLRARSLTGSSTTWLTISQAQLPQFFAEGLITESGGQLIALGCYPVLVSNTTVGPDGTDPDAGCAYIYAHGPVDYALGEIEARSVFIAETNQTISLAERYAIVRVDSCDTFAIQTKLTCC